MYIKRRPLFHDLAAPEPVLDDFLDVSKSRHIARDYRGYMSDLQNGDFLDLFKYQQQLVRSLRRLEAGPLNGD
jgi:hypothetical protein